MNSLQDAWNRRQVDDLGSVATLEFTIRNSYFIMESTLFLTPMCSEWSMFFIQDLVLIYQERKKFIAFFIF